LEVTSTQEDAITKQKTGLSQESPGGRHIAPDSTAAATTTKGATRAICKISYKQEASGGGFENFLKYNTAAQRR